MIAGEEARNSGPAFESMLKRSPALLQIRTMGGGAQSNT